MIASLIKKRSPQQWAMLAIYLAACLVICLSLYIEFWVDKKPNNWDETMASVSRLAMMCGLFWFAKSKKGRLMLMLFIAGFMLVMASLYFIMLVPLSAWTPIRWFLFMVYLLMLLIYREPDAESHSRKH